MLQSYLDKDGEEIRPQDKPIFVRKPTKKQRMLKRMAKYVRCNRETVQGLIWIGHCEDCELFGGHVQHKGIICNIK